MDKDAEIILAEDDGNYAKKFAEALKSAGVENHIRHFNNGRTLIEFLFGNGHESLYLSDKAYILLLDIGLPEIGGVKVLTKLKSHSELCKMPVLIITNTIDMEAVNLFHALGCSNYIPKPTSQEDFLEFVERLGLFLDVLQVPKLYKK